MRALIVDDEPLARRGVVLQAAKIQGCRDRWRMWRRLNCRGKNSGVIARSCIPRRSMPGMDGFDVLRALPREKLPGIIFLTAYEQHALRAFEFHALDYLLKPVRRCALCSRGRSSAQTVDSALKATMAERVLEMLDRTADKYASRFTVQTGSRIQIVSGGGCRVDWRSGRLCGIACRRPFLSVTRDDGFAGTEARPGKVSSHTPLPNCAIKRHSGAAIHREPRIHGEALRTARNIARAAPTLIDLNAGCPLAARNNLSGQLPHVR